MKTQINFRKNQILKEDLMWLKRPNYKVRVAQPCFNLASDNTWLNMEGFYYVSKNIVSHVLYGNRFDVTMPVVNTVYNCIKKAEEQRKFYFKTSAAMLFMINIFLLVVLFRL